MADQAAILEIQVESGSADKAKKSLADLSAQGAAAEASMKKVGTSGADASSGVDKYSRSTDKASTATSSLVTSLRATAAAYVSFQSVAAVGRIADDYTKLSAQLKLSTNSQQEFATAYANAISIARSSQSDLGAISTLYARLNNSLKDLGATQGQVSAIAETVALSLKASGAGAAESASAMLQLSQAFGSGVLRGEEFNAIAEAAPGLLRVLAQSLNVPVGLLRSMASEGQLTADVLAKAFADPKVLEGLRVQSKEINTISSAWTALKNEVVIAVGEFDKANSISSTLASGIVSLSQNLDVLKIAAGGAAAGLAAFYGPSIITGLGTLATALRGLSLALLGPVGLAAGLAAATIAFLSMRDKAVPALDQVIARQKELKALQESGQESSAADPYIAQKTAIAELAKTYDGLKVKIESLQNARGVARANAETSIVNLNEQLKITSTLLAEAKKNLADLQNSGGGTPPDLKSKSFMILTSDLKSAADIRKEYLKTKDEIVAAANAEGIAYDVLQGKLKALTEKYYGKAKAEIADNTYAKQRAESYAELFKAAVALNAPQETQIDQLKRMAAEFSNLDAKSKEYLQTQIQIAAEREDDSYIVRQQKATDEALDSIKKQTDALLEENEAFGKLPSAITAVTIARMKDRKERIASLGLATDDIDAQIEELNRLRSAQSSKEFNEKEAEAAKKRKEEAKKTADEIQRKYETMSDNINRSLTDALLRGFESGKSFAENFKDTLINMFKTLVLQPIVRFLVDSSGISKIATLLTSSLSGTASASGIASNVAGGGSGAGSFISLAKNIYSGITSGFDSLNASLVGKIGDLGTYLVDKGFNSLGGAIGQYNTVIANALPYSAAILQLVKGDIKGAAVTGITTAIGSAIGGPVGGAIGAAVGSLLGGVFGGGTPLRNWAQVKATTTDGNFQVTDTFSKRGGASAISPLTNVSKTFSEQLSSFLDDLGSNAIINTVAAFSTRPGKKTKAAFEGSVNGAFFSIGQITYGKKDAEAWTKYINSVFGAGLVAAIKASDISQGFKDLFTGFTDRNQVASLMQSVINFQTASEELNDTYGITADTAAKIARAGGATNEEIASFANTFSSFALSLKTPGEQLLLAKTNITSAIEDIVGSIGSLDSLSAFDSLLKGIDTTTAEGQAQFADLFKLRDSFSSYFASLTSIKDNVQSSLFSLFSPGDQAAFLQGELEKAFSSLDIAVPTSVDELIKLGQSIDYTTEAGLDLAAAFPGLVSAFTNAQSATDALVESLNSLDTSRFKTLFDYERYKAVATNSGTTFANNYQKTALPAFDVGTNYVPSDMTAQIHKGERIIPAADNAALMQKLDQSNNTGLLDAVQKLTQINESLAKNVASMERKIAKWDGDGLPAERVLA